MIVTVSPRSTASRRSEKCRDASVAVTVRMQEGYLIIRFTSRPGSPGSDELRGGAPFRSPFPILGHNLSRLESNAVDRIVCEVGRIGWLLYVRIRRHCD
jgi:hypothetical protein